MKRVLGIDPAGQVTGWGVVEGDGKRLALIEYGVIRLSPRRTFSGRLLEIGNKVEELISRFNPDICAVEEAFFASNFKTALQLGHVRGVVLVEAERAGIAIFEYSPRLVKQTVVGYGNAEKHQVQEMVRVLLSLSAVPEPHDAADALAVAICHLSHMTGRDRLAAARALSGI